MRLFTRATSLGGPESLIEHRASVEGPESRTPPGLLRLSIGLEHPEDLVEDLDQALGARLFGLDRRGLDSPDGALGGGGDLVVDLLVHHLLELGHRGLGGGADLAQRHRTGNRTVGSGSSSALISAGTAGAAAGPIPEIS